LQAEIVTAMSYKINLKTIQSALTNRYVIDDRFFEAIGKSLVQKGSLNAVVDVAPEKNGEFNVHIAIDGAVIIPCDRCLDDMEFPIACENDVQVKLGFDAGETDTHIIVDESEGLFDVAPLIYDYIVLSIPIHHVHAEGQCNAAMTEQLKNYLVN
jgi:uncharacterized metal-binding protein YceD (DUF177 family)